MLNLIHTELLSYLRGNLWLVQNGYLPKHHAVLCDPPYALISIVKRYGAKNAAPAKFGTDGVFSRSSAGFMNQIWDSFDSLEDYQDWVEAWGELLLHYVYPGAVGMFFGGTRTFHRLACGLENAGWEIFDCISYTYGSGFPKSHDISKAMDREAGAEREVVGISDRHGGGRPFADGNGGFNTEISCITAPSTPDAQRWNGWGTALKPSWEPVILARAPRLSHTYAGLAKEYGSGALNIDGGRLGVSVNEPNKRGDTGGYIKTETPPNTIFGGTFYHSSRPATLTQGRWPANTVYLHTPDCVKVGVKKVKGDNGSEIVKDTGAGWYEKNGDGHRQRYRDSDGNETVEEWRCSDDCPVRMLDEQAGERPVSGTAKLDKVNHAGISFFGRFPAGYESTMPNDSGSASRFFYTAKASNWEREAGLDEFERQIGGSTHSPADLSLKTGSGNERNNLRRNTHPTVKPIQLTTWLATLLLPPPGQERRILIPFGGVGSEMIGAHLAGWDVVTGLEMTKEYVEQGRARLAWWSRFKTYEQAEASYQSANRGNVENAKLEAIGQLRLL